MPGPDAKMLQTEVNKLVSVLMGLNYPSRSLGPLQDNLLPPARFEMTSATLLTLVRWLETDALPIYTTFLQEYIVDPRMVPDQTIVYLMYNTIIDLLHYEPRVSAEAFLDRICGAITEELRDLHYYRVRTVRIFANLLKDLHLRWVRHSSNKMRGTDGFIVLLPSTLKPQMPYFAQRWSSHPALVIHQPENAAYRGVVSDTPSDTHRVSRASMSAPMVPMPAPAPVPRYSDPAYLASQQISQLVNNTRTAVGMHMQHMPRDTAVRMTDLPDDIQHRISDQFISTHRRERPRRNESRSKRCGARSVRRRQSDSKRRHAHRRGRTESPNLSDESSYYSYDSSYYSDYSTSYPEHSDEAEQMASHSRSRSHTSMAKSRTHAMSPSNSRNRRPSRFHSRHIHDDRVRSHSKSRRSRSRSGSRSRDHRNNTFDSKVSSRSTYEVSDKRHLSGTNNQLHSGVTSTPTTGHPSIRGGDGRHSSSSPQERDLTDKELLLQLGRATAKKYANSTGDFYGTDRQMPGSLQQTSEFPASNSDPSLILNTAAPQYSQKDEDTLASTAVPYSDFHINQLATTPVQCRPNQAQSIPSATQTALSTGPMTLPAMPMTSSYPPSCNAYNGPLYNVQTAHPATPLYPGYQQGDGGMVTTSKQLPFEASTSSVPIYHFPDNGVYVPGYPRVTPSEFNQAGLLYNTNGLPAASHGSTPASASLTPHSTVQKHLDQQPIIVDGVNLRPLLEKNPDPYMEQMIENEIRKAEADPRILEEINKLENEGNFRRSITSTSIALPPASTSGSAVPSSNYHTPMVGGQVLAASYSGTPQIGRIDSHTNELLPAPSITNSNAATSIPEKTSSLPPPTVTASNTSSMPPRGMSVTTTATTTGSADDYTDIVNRALQSTPSVAPPRPSSGSAATGSYASQTFYDNLTSYSGKELSSSFRERISRLVRESSSTPETASVTGHNVPTTKTTSSSSNRVLITNNPPGLAPSSAPHDVTNMVAIRANSALKTPVKTPVASAVPLMVNKHGQVQVNPDIVFPDIPPSERQKPEYKAAIEAEALRQTHTFVPDTSKYHSVGDLTEEDLKKSGIAYIREPSTSGSSSIPECVIGHLVNASRSALGSTKHTPSTVAPEVALASFGQVRSVSRSHSSETSPQELQPGVRPLQFSTGMNQLSTRASHAHPIQPPESIPMSDNVQNTIAAITDRVEHVQSELIAATSGVSTSHSGSASESAVVVRQPRDLSRLSTGYTSIRREDTPVTGTRGESVMSSMNTMSTKSVRFAGQDTTDSHDDLSLVNSSTADNFLNQEASSSVVSSRQSALASGFTSASAHRQQESHETMPLPTPSANTSVSTRGSISNLPLASNTSHTYDMESKRSLMESARSLNRTATTLQRLQSSNNAHSSPVSSSPKEYMNYQLQSTTGPIDTPSVRKSTTTPSSAGGSLPPPESTLLTTTTMNNTTTANVTTTGSTLMPPSSTTNTAVSGSSSRPNLYMPNLAQSTEMISSVGNPIPGLNTSTLILSEGAADPMLHRNGYGITGMHSEPKYPVPQYAPLGAPPTSVPLVADRIAAAMGSDRLGDASHSTTVHGSSTVSRAPGTSSGSSGSGSSGGSTNTIRHFSDATSENANGLGTLSVNAHRQSTESPPSNGLEASRAPLSGSRLRELMAQGENLVRAANEIETMFAPPSLNQPSSTGTTIVGPNSLGSTNLSGTTYSG